MARIRYYDFRAPDSTLLFNDSLRAILLAGVYWGYNVSVGGSGGWYLKFTHDSDPDKTGEVLGKLFTRDGVFIEENANQDDVCVGSAPGGSDENHWVVASYVYNQSLPNNDVSYIVKTAVAPATPTLTDDEVLIAEIFVPTGSSSYSSSGVDIRSVQKRSLYDFPNVVASFDGILKPGIYSGIDMSEGGTALDISLSAGTWLTQQMRPIVESSAQTDLVTLTNPGVGQYRYAWLVGMHKDESTDPIPDVDYILVEGSAVAIGSEATLPNDSAILTAAQAVDAKYTDTSYINKLGYVRCENRSGTYYINYYKGETPAEENLLVVHAGEDVGLRRSGEYYGHQGFLQAIADIFAKMTSTTLDRAYTILLDGEFKLADTSMHIPSNTRLRGLGAPAKLLSEDNEVVLATGWEVDWDTSNNTVAQTNLGVGEERITIQAAYQTGDDLQDFMIAPGDEFIFWSTAEARTYLGTVTVVNSAWQFDCTIDTDWASDLYPKDLDIVIFKRNIHLENLEVGNLGISANGALSFKYLRRSGIDNVKVGKFNHDLIQKCVINRLRTTGGVSFGGDYIGTSADGALSESNSYDNFLIEGGSTPQTLFTNENSGRIGLLSYIDSGTTMELVLNGSRMAVEFLENLGASGSKFQLDCSGSISTIRGASEIGVGQLQVQQITGNVTFESGCQSCHIQYVNGTVTDNATSKSNRVYHTFDADNVNEFLEHANIDRNVRPMSLANVSWDLASNTITWDAAIYWDIPYQTGYNRIIAGSVSLSADGARAYFSIARGATGTTDVSLSTTAKANCATLRRNPDIYNFAVRKDDVIYLWDGTRIEDGQIIKIGTTPPPDGSVNYQKFITASLEADPDPLGYLNQVLRDYVSVIESTDSFGWKNDTLFRNTGNVNYTYTSSTGIIQFVSTVDLEDAEDAIDAGIPLTFLLINTEWDPGTANKGAYTREAILDVDDTANTVTIAKGLDISSPQTGSRWNGAIVRGNMVVSNEGLVTFTYTPQGSGRGRITYASNMLFTSYQVDLNYVFVDSGGNEFMIIARDSSGNGAWVDISVGLRTVDTTNPTTKYQGSIRTNNNPYKIPMADLRGAYGGEFVPIDGYAEPDCLIDDQLTRAYHTDAGPTINHRRNLQRRFVAPYDPRVRMWCEPSTRYSNDEEVTDVLGLMPITTQGAQWIEFTGICTGLALVLTGNPTSTANIEAYVDGERVDNDLMSVSGKDCNSTYDYEINRYELVTCGRLKRMPQGIHHVMFYMPSTQYSNLLIRGLYVVNSPLTSNKFLDCPGLLVKSGGLIFKDDPAGMQALPAAPTYDKGRRLIRYVDSSSMFAWAETQVKTFTDTGDIATSATITNVGNASQWRIGDAILLINTTTGTRYFHRITAISGSTITVTPNTGFTQSGITMYFYGRVYTAMGAAADVTTYREYEEIAFHANAQEFAAPDHLYGCRGAAGMPGQVKSVAGVRMSDCTTALLASGASGVGTDTGGGVLLSVTGTILRIWFVGTGLSIQRDESVGSCALKVDGLSCGNMAANTGSPVDFDSDPGGTYICGDMPYGQHVIEMTANDASPSTILKAITVWQPKKPSFSGFETVDMNLLGVSEATMNIDDHDGTDMNGVDESQFGTINLEAGSIAHPVTTNAGVFEDVSGGVAADGIIARVHDVAGANLTDDDVVDFVFWGDEITLVTGDITLGTGTIDIFFLDHDGQYRAPSAVTGFTISSSYGDTLPTHTTSARRFRWEMDLGLHVLRVQFNSPQVGTTAMEFDAIEVHTPVHNYRTKQPVCIDHSVPFCNGGVDKRNLIPLRADLLPKAQVSHVQGSLVNKDSANACSLQSVFVFYTRGGLIDISVSAELTDSSGGASVSMNIDGLSDGPTVLVAAAATAQITIHRVIYLPAGFHFACVSTDDITNDTIRNVQWVVRQDQAVPTQLASRGASVPMLGPAHPGESSF